MEQKIQQYTCPMHPEVIKDAPGQCPKCGMNLVPIKGDTNTHEENQVHQIQTYKAVSPEKSGNTGSYYCPMLCEGDRKYDKPGNCPVCGMHLVKEQKFESLAIEYTCPMHPEIIRVKPGNCPICGMHLEPKKVEKDNASEEAAYKSMLKKFWIAILFTLPILALSMGELVGLNLDPIASRVTWGWVQFILATPVVFYCTGDFFIRGYQSVIRLLPNMWTLISLGAGAAYLFSIVALVFPQIFPDQFKMNGSVHLKLIGKYLWEYQRNNAEYIGSTCTQGNQCPHIW